MTAQERGAVTWAVVCELGLTLPGMELSTSYGTPALKVGGDLVVRLREDLETVALRIGFPEREALIGTEPATFFITDHYLNHPAVVVRLSQVRRDVMLKLLTETWRVLAPSRRRAPRKASRKEMRKTSNPRRDPG